MKNLPVLLFTTVWGQAFGAWYNEYTGMELNHPSGVGTYNGKYMFTGSVPYPQVGNSAYELDFQSGGVTTYWAIYKSGTRVIKQKCNDAGNEGPFSYSLGTHCGCYWNVAGGSAVAFGINGTDVVHTDKCGPSTNVPTLVPTAIPTLTPTAVPTHIPTLIPTAMPTHIPTLIPTAMPTLHPTAVPTHIPTLIPTPVPRTPEPTWAPSPVPTAVPTAVPTIAPTAVPTIAPATVVPTAVPTPESVNITPTVTVTVVPETPSEICPLIFLSNSISCPINSTLVGGGIIRLCKTDVCKLLDSIDLSGKGANVKGINGLDVVVQYDKDGKCVVLDYDGDWASENAICRKYVVPACDTLTREHIATSTDSDCVAKGGTVSRAQFSSCGADICWELDTMSTRSPMDPELIYKCNGLDLQHHTQTTAEAGEIFPILCDVCSAIKRFANGCPEGYQLASSTLVSRCANQICGNLSNGEQQFGNQTAVVRTPLSCGVIPYTVGAFPPGSTFLCVAVPVKSESSGAGYLIPIVVVSCLCFFFILLSVAFVLRKKRIEEGIRRDALVEMTHDLEELDDGSNNWKNLMDKENTDNQLL
eukprot:TRINITY_DN8650_c0_g1_i1.p1 TRINITY_DN8650_c0_g1~~TRINITY_DN8650_c0_g1_i1.p1  ORF type:complete len:599 (+),score=104.27 TRINITY_DN8650_c0_g1_i1:41-1798(+)